MGANPAHRVSVRLTGTFEVSLDGVRLEPARLGSRRARLLLALLAVERQRHVSVDEIAHVLWPDAAPARPEPGVATLVSRLRGVLGAEAVAGRRGSYQLGMAPAVEVDLDRAAALIEEAERRLAAEPALAASAAGRALAILGMTVLDDQPYAVWAEVARTEHAGLVRRARQVGARAALATGDGRAGAEHALARIAADPLDESAYRDLMSAHQASGQPAEALAAYERLRATLRDELGIDPSSASRDLFLAVLRDQPAVQPTELERPSTVSRHLAGRTAELSRLETAWAEVAGGGSKAVLLVGEAGIGKSRLAEELHAIAEGTGGTVLSVRCYETERSLFLQPLAEALTPALARMQVAAVVELAGPDAHALVGLLPALGSMLGLEAEAGGTVELRRQRVFQALAGLLARLAHRSPVLLVVDDLHLAGRSTLELLHFLLRRSAPARLMLLATSRVEDAELVRQQLGELMEELELSPLDHGAIEGLAAAAGRAELADIITQRTSGHTLYVVEVLRALAAGSADVPTSLQQAVLDRVRRTGADCESMLRAAAILGTTLEPATLAALRGTSVQAMLDACERALSARLLVVAGRSYEFAHDLVREVLYETTPEPTRVAYHRAAADLLTDRPETLAAHAAACGDWPRAARAWLVAAERGLQQLATLDAAALADAAHDAAVQADDSEIKARALLVRGRAREAAAAFTEARSDLESAVIIARGIGDRRLEMLALRQMGGDVSTALGLPAPELVGHLVEALRIAETLGDRQAEADLLSRVAVISTNRLRFADAITQGERALRAARASGDLGALCLALDGIKTSHAYLGEVEPLRALLTELEPMLRERRDMWLLPWAVFESAFVPLAAGDHQSAADRMTEALELSRRGGWVSHESWFVGHLGWAARLRGDLGAARAYGQDAVTLADEYGHRWWRAAAMSMQACTLLATGETEDAVDLLERALPIAEEVGAESYHLRCVAPLAELTGSWELLQRADDLLGEVDCPAGSAWLLGSDAYLCTARAWLARDEPVRAAAVVAPMLTAARRVPWVPLLAIARPLEVALQLR